MHDRGGPRWQPTERHELEMANAVGQVLRNGFAKASEEHPSPPESAASTSSRLKKASCFLLDVRTAGSKDDRRRTFADERLQLGRRWGCLAFITQGKPGEHGLRRPIGLRRSEPIWEERQDEFRRM